MKKTILFILMAVFVLQSCKKDDEKETTENQVEQLPPATQTGAGTFACYVNGKAFIDKSGGWFNCFYQFVDGKYYFSIQGHDYDYKNNINYPWSIGLGSIDMTIAENVTISLHEYNSDTPCASGFVMFSRSAIDSKDAITNQEYTGELIITKMDFNTRIISGTFWFDVQNPYTGERVEIREGRFDTKFTM